MFILWPFNLFALILLIDTVAKAELASTKNIID
jgi:hypothetical protein